VINELREPIPNAKVTILKGETELVAVYADADGKFSFERLEAGNYVIRVQADNYKSAQSPIVIVKPTMKCKRGLRVMLGVGMQCSGINLAKR
jgi:Carboxypeptidase regulatory-like domain